MHDATGRGRERIFELRPQRLDAAHRYLDQISCQWDEALARLQAYVEQDAEPGAAREAKPRTED